MKKLFLILSLLGPLIGFVPHETYADVAANAGRDVYTGNASTVSFTGTFKILTSANVAVYLDGVLKVLNTHYSVTGVGNDAGFTVTFLTAPSNAVQVLLIRNQPIEQTSSYIPGSISAATIERDFDRQTSINQAQQEQLERSIKFNATISPIPNTLTQLPAPSASKCWAWNSAGTAVEFVTCGSGGGSSPTPPGGSTTQVQVNLSGAFTGYSGFTFNGTVLSVPNDILVGGVSVCLEDGTNCPAGSGDNQTAAEVPFTPAGSVAATNVQTAIQELDTEKQPLDADLTALAANSTPGLWVAGTNVPRTLTGTTEQVAVANGSGAGGNPTLSIPSPLTIPGLLHLSNVSPAQITADQNGYAGCAGAITCRVSTNATRTITGFVAPTGGRILYIVNVGSFDLVLANESASSSGAERITIFGAADFTVPPKGIAMLVYDLTAARWRFVTLPAPTAAVATTLAKYIPPEVTVATLPASPEPNRMVTVTDGATPGSCGPAGGGFNRTDCRWNSVSNHWEPAVPAAGGASQSYQQVLTVGRVNTTAVDLTTAVRDGNDTVQMARFCDSSNVCQEQMVNATGTAIPFDRVYRIDAGKVLDVQNHLGVSLLQVDEATGAVLIGGSAGSAGECLKSQGAGSPPHWTTC
jgi:hypothetical protein